MPPKAQRLRHSNPMDIHNEKSSDKSRHAEPDPFIIVHHALTELLACRQAMIAKAIIQ